MKSNLLAVSVWEGIHTKEQPSLILQSSTLKYSYICWRFRCLPSCTFWCRRWTWFGCIIDYQNLTKVDPLRSAFRSDSVHRRKWIGGKMHTTWNSWCAQLVCRGSLLGGLSTNACYLFAAFSLSTPGCKAEWAELLPICCRWVKLPVFEVWCFNDGWSVWGLEGDQRIVHHVITRRHSFNH